MDLRYRTCLGITMVLCMAFFFGCKSELADETPLALVNNEPITYGEFKRELKGFHLSTKEKEKIGPIDIKDFLDKLIRKRLFIQEAVRTGLDREPNIHLAVDSELKKQALRHLHREEIEDKVIVTEEESWEEYCAQLKQHRDKVERIKEGLSIDPNSQSKEAKNYLSWLVKRSEIEVDPNFIWSGEEQSDPNLVVAKVNTKSITGHDLSNAINNIQNDFGGEDGWRYALRQLINEELLEQEIKRFVPSRDSFKTEKKRVEKGLLKTRLTEREDAYLEELRRKAKISRVAIDPNDFFVKEQDPNYPMAWVNDEPITFGKVKSILKEKVTKNGTVAEKVSSIEESLQYLIDCLLVDQEALSRGYENRSDVREALKNVREKVIYNNFFRKLLVPSIKFTDDEVDTYYQEHPDEFCTPVYVKVEEIRLKTDEEANQIWSELEAGADFTFLSQRSLPQRITSIHWTPADKLGPSVKEGLTQVEEGGRFGPVEWEKGYSIFLLKRRRGGEVLPFDRVKQDAQNKLWKERSDQLIKKWDTVLRSSSEIVIYEKRLQAILAGVGVGRNNGEE